MVDLVAIQAEQMAWSERNFGKQEARKPHLGILEELGELGMALCEHKSADVLDAVGDIGIYTLDFCGKKGWSLDEFWQNRAWFTPVLEPIRNHLHIHTLVKHLAHHQLKGEQNIRGGTAHHEAEMKRSLLALMWAMEMLCTHYLSTEFPKVVEHVWSRVRLRDWTKNKNTAHEVAEQQVIDMDAAAKSNDP